MAKDRKEKQEQKTEKMQNLAAQKDPTLQAMIWEWCREKDTKRKDKMWQEAKKYWAKRRLELGFTGPEE